MMTLTPEHSMHIQNTIGADIMMPLDDVVSSTTTGPRVEEAMERTIRWLDRCIAAHKRPHEQNLFGIVQGGLSLELRERCTKALVERDLPGYAIGGLSGGESKDQFWRVVKHCTSLLPPNKPRYLMGVGYPVDLVVCVCLGVDMFDCVFPTRTARFGTALVPEGSLHLKAAKFSEDYGPIDSECDCFTCQNYTRAMLHSIVIKEPIAGQLLTMHNISYLLRLMRTLHQKIVAGELPEFVREFMKRQFPQRDFPQWVIEALASVNITLEK
eukprot:TRINITY_DN7381_c0_g1_i1.p1 TRINITY_DN7381_c0_g1~~TRINITY_DN7381_c0_g1_i1.p1  ORF type:complete len:269 (+),score=65.56 TRINITY_DN7381_c0_g1_i1:616-1422(+)